MLGALALGHQAVNADTVPTTTDNSTAQSVQATSTVLPQVKAVALTASVDQVESATSSSDDFGDNDDSNLPGGDTGQAHHQIMVVQIHQVTIVALIHQRQHQVMIMTTVQHCQMIMVVHHQEMVDQVHHQ
nr:hypothetical protein [Leuconostoc citreum]